MIKKAIGFILVLTFSVISCAAEDVSISGTLKSSADGSVVPFANIMVYSLPDSVLLGYAISSDDGTFTVNLSSCPKTLLIKVSCLGFKHQSISAKTTAIPLSIILEPDSKMLADVVITGRSPGIKVSGDTINYNIKKYTTGNEKVLKDILEKLPGMDVDSKGQVTANGEPVKKILIDGQDFFGNQNEQITNNLPANMVDKIQLQKNYSEFSLLKGFNTHRANALNVQIDSLHHGSLTGNAELLGGWPYSYRSAANVYSFGSKAMFGLNAKYFNTGEEVMTLLDYIKLLGSVNDYAQSFGGQDRVVDNRGNLPSFLEYNINTYKRRNALISTNIAWNPKERLKMNAYYLFNLESSRGKYDINRKYLGTDSTATFTEKSKDRRLFHHFGLNMKYQIDDYAALDSRTTVTAMPQTSNRHIEVTKSSDHSAEYNITHRTALVKNWNNRDLLSLSGELNFQYSTRRLEVFSDSMLYNLPHDIDLVWQKQKMSTLDAFFTTSWTHKLSKFWQMSQSIGWDLIRNEISANALLPAFDIASQSLITNIYDYTLSFSKKKGLLQCHGGLTIADIRNRLTKRVALLPDIKFELVFSPTNSISMSYRSSYQTDDEMFIQGTILNDYRQYSIYNATTNVLHRRDELQLGMNYFDILNDFTFIMNTGCSFTAHPYIPNYQSVGYGEAVSYQKADNSNRTQYAYFNIKKGFCIPITLSVKSTMTNSLFQSMYQNMLSNNRFSQIDGSLALLSKFKSLVNIEVGYKLSLQQSKTGLGYQMLNYASHEICVTPMLLRKDHFELNVPTSYIIDHSRQNTYKLFNLGITALLNSGRWSFSVEGRNILHTQSLRRLRIESESNYQETITENRLPGYIIGGVKYIF